MDNQGQASTEMPLALTRGYANSYLDSRVKGYVSAVDQPPLTIADLDAMDHV